MGMRRGSHEWAVVGNGRTVHLADPYSEDGDIIIVYSTFVNFVILLYEDPSID